MSNLTKIKIKYVHINKKNETSHKKNYELDMWCMWHPCGIV